MDLKTSVGVGRDHFDISEDSREWSRLCAQGAQGSDASEC